MDYQPHGNCYVLLDGKDDLNDLILEHKNDLIIYPERSMRFVDLACYRPYVLSVVTESAWIIGMYSKHEVWIYKDGKWVHPHYQTYGTSRDMIESNLFDYDSSIPLHVIGSDRAKEFSDGFEYPSKFIR
jgi:hypothetical protein